MGRPPRGKGPAAVARLEAAFFDELRKMPFRGLTIRAIVQSAGVNRNSFYYHFADLDDLARTAVAHLLNSEVPRLIASGFALESKEFDRLVVNAIQGESFARMLTITGPNSTSELRDVLKGAVIDLWLEAFQLERDDLNVQETASVHYVLGGALELLTKFETRDQFTEVEMPILLDRLAAMRELPVIQANSWIMADVLGAAKKRSIANISRNS